MKKQPIEGYVRQIFLLTDGAVSSVNPVLTFVNSHNGINRVHGIGIGSDCSSELI